MPVYVLAAMKSHAFRLLTHSQQLDEKVSCVQNWLGLSLNKVAYLFYPRIYCITDVLDVVHIQKSYGTGDIDWGFFTDESETTLVKPKIKAC